VAYYLGIDGGGSKTTCAVGDEAHQFEIAIAGPSNITRVGKIRAREALHQTIRQACAASKIDPRQVERACIGVAGAGREEVASAVRGMVAELIPGEIEVVGDMEIALAAAFGTGPGVIVIAGTGSIAYGRDAQRRTARAGGWGYAISDEGSAHWIGRTAVSALLRAIDQDAQGHENAQSAAEAKPLFSELKAAWKLHSLDKFVRTANSNPDFAALLPAVVGVADAGDALAQRVLTQAGYELAKLAGIVVRRSFVRRFADDVSSVPLAMVGGVFRHSSRVCESFCNEVRKFEVPIDLNPQVVEPVVGALQKAREAAGKN
jgi:glucosamine kinase